MWDIKDCKFIEQNNWDLLRVFGTNIECKKLKYIKMAVSQKILCIMTKSSCDLKKKSKIVINDKI